MDKQLRELLSVVSHQIRSPLAAIKGYVSLIIEGSYGAVDERAREALDKVQHSVDELVELVDDLLDMRKAMAEKMEYQFLKVDLGKVVAEAIIHARMLAEGKKLEFSFIEPKKEIWVNADSKRLKQAIHNLADNAVKYTPNGFARIEIREEGRDAIVSVLDSGIGIPPALLPHIFEEFVRDERVKSGIRGTGLGLSIARKIAEAHGGKIWAESPGEEKGSAFHMSIPTV